MLVNKGADDFDSLSVDRIIVNINVCFDLLFLRCIPDTLLLNTHRVRGAAAVHGAQHRSVHAPRTYRRARPDMSFVQR